MWRGWSDVYWTKPEGSFVKDMLDIRCYVESRSGAEWWDRTAEVSAPHYDWIHVAERSDSIITFAYIWCFAERSGAKYGSSDGRSEPDIRCCARVSDVRSESATTPKRIFQYFFIPYYFVEEFYHFIGIFIFSFFFFQEGFRGELEKEKHLILLSSDLPTYHKRYSQLNRLCSNQFQFF